MTNMKIYIKQLQSLIIVFIVVLFTFSTDKAIFILSKYHVHSLTYINVSSLDLRNSNSDSFTTFYNYK